MNRTNRMQLSSRELVAVKKMGVATSGTGNYRKARFYARKGSESPN
jgi:hypothetical protein